MPSLVVSFSHTNADIDGPSTQSVNRCGYTGELPEERALETTARAASFDHASMADIIRILGVAISL
jgi:hypothetical protein